MVGKGTRSNLATWRALLGFEPRTVQFWQRRGDYLSGRTQIDFVGAEDPEMSESMTCTSEWRWRRGRGRCWQVSRLRLSKRPRRNRYRWGYIEISWQRQRGRRPSSPMGRPTYQEPGWAAERTADIANPKGLKTGGRSHHAAVGRGTREAPPIEGRPGSDCLPAGIPRGSPIVEDRSNPNGTTSFFTKATSTATGISSWTPSIPRIPILPGSATRLAIGRKPWSGYRWVQRQVLGRLQGSSPHRTTSHPRALHSHGHGDMSMEITIIDSGAYAKPFTTVGKATLMPGTELLEYIRQENNQDLPLLRGPARGPGGQ